MNSKGQSQPPTNGPTKRGTKWEPPSPHQLQDLLQGFEVIKLIGRGGMGAVYKARQISLDRMVAIKLLPPVYWDSAHEHNENFRNEARMLARLMHPGIVTIFDFDETRDGQLFFVMEYIDGMDVAHMLFQRGKLPPMHALSIAAHVCDTLQYAHERGVIHHDIKPGNVMVDIEGKVKVADFGLAELGAKDPSHAESTTMGTPDYLAPEGLLIGVQVDHRADLYAIGVMLHEMLTGKVPRNPLVLPSAKVQGLDKRFDACVKKALQADPNLRYQSAADFRRDLDHILAMPAATASKAKRGPVRPLKNRSATKTTIRPTVVVRKTPEPGKTPWGWIVLAFIAVVTAAYFYFQSIATPQEPEDETSGPAPTTASPESNQKN